MDPVCFRDPNGLLPELAVDTLAPPPGSTMRAVMEPAPTLRVEQGAYAIAQEHPRVAIERLQPAPGS